MNGVAIAVAGTAISAIAGCVVAGSEKGKKWDNYGLKQIFSEKKTISYHDLIAVKNNNHTHNGE